jgi:hypothetical protein
LHLHHEIIGAIYRRGPEAEGTSAKFSSAVPVSVRRVTGGAEQPSCRCRGQGKVERKGSCSSRRPDCYVIQRVSLGRIRHPLHVTRCADLIFFFFTTTPDVQHRMKTDRIRTDITYFIFVFIFLVGFGYEYE